MCLATEDNDRERGLGLSLASGPRNEILTTQSRLDDLPV